MRSLVTDGRGNLEIRHIARPLYNEYQALVKLESCGICGTDSKIINGQFKGFDHYPASLGHEGVGRVVELGSKVTSFSFGDRVLLPFMEEAIDGVNSGWGAFSEYAIIGDAQALLVDGKGPGDPQFSEAYYAQQRIPDEISSVDAAMIVTFREVLSAIKRFNFQAGESVVIFGAGPVGLTFTKMAKLLGLGPVVVSVNRDSKIDEAKAVGADYVFNSSTVDIVRELKALFPQGVDQTVDAVGLPEIMNQSMKVVKHNGKICCYGVPKEQKMELDWSQSEYNWSLHFLQWPSKLEESLCHEQILEWMAEGRLIPSDYISDIVHFDDAVEAFAAAKNKSGKKVVITFDK
ncbi:zinc-dependent alcohol dehydrogenase [Paenibacillus paeoniae]|uniref:Sorbitol dehydrogenase n=1 Tax=Paenibacillus paeoniae TaxID=2292705 RepID=A0A371P5Q4_9BACL|nr:zinc-binding dehydrogenase [Paenibacillus paeoniae]REK71205.1 sorbitol dehydrogenase [Paenibacillus paeoniae]